jgi:hypothetical protein
MIEVIAFLYTPAQIMRLFIDILVNDCAETPVEFWRRFGDYISQDNCVRLGSRDQAL